MILLATSPLLKMLYSSLVAGVGVALVFALAIFGVVRSSEMRRSGRSGAAVAYAALAATGLLVSAGVVVYGLILVGHRG